MTSPLVEHIAVVRHTIGRRGVQREPPARLTEQRTIYQIAQRNCLNALRQFAEGKYDSSLVACILIEYTVIVETSLGSAINRRKRPKGKFELNVCR